MRKIISIFFAREETAITFAPAFTAKFFAEIRGKNRDVLD